MKKKSLLLAIEAVVLVGPMTVQALYGLPLLLVHIMESGEAPSVVIRRELWVLGCVLAFVAFWRLALATVREEVQHFGLLFWLGTAGGLMGALELMRWVSSGIGYAYLVAPFICAAHFAHIQFKRQKSLALT